MLCTRVELRGRLNVLNLNTHCEDFFVRLLNRLLGYQLSNINATKPNAEGVDLVDHASKIVLQVSATASKQKVESALAKDLTSYKGYRFRFMPIAVNASDLAKKSFKNPHGLAFDPSADIIDIKFLLDIIKGMSLTDQQEVLALLNEELTNTPQGSPTHLADVIRLIAAEDFGKLEPSSVVGLFNVDDKLLANQLSVAKGVIEDYKIHHSRVDRIYSDFDQSGHNKSRSILDSFRHVYLKLSLQFTGDELFLQIVDHMMDKVITSANYVEIQKDELLLCVNILAVDAFIRCKIFKAPQAPAHVVA